MKHNTDRGVSPVIGVVLMVAVTVILAGIIAVGFYGIGQQPSSTSPVGAEFKNMGNDTVQIRIIDYGNAESIQAICGSNSVNINSVGTPYEIDTASCSEISIVTTSSSGSTSVVQSAEISEMPSVSSADTVGNTTALVYSDGQLLRAVDTTGAEVWSTDVGYTIHHVESTSEGIYVGSYDNTKIDKYDFDGNFVWNYDLATNGGAMGVSYTFDIEPQEGGDIT